MINVKALGFEDIVYYEDRYEVVNVNDDSIDSITSFSTYLQAYKYYDENIDNYDNLAITYKGLFLRIEYGIVTFNKSNSCDVNFEFRNVLDNNSNYLNACYGVDGAYLDTDSDMNVYFKVAGVIGYSDINDLTIIPVNFLKENSVNSYIVNDGDLYHQVKNDIDSSYYVSLINLGKAPSFLEEDVIYYSYDSHYFYYDLQMMLDDYKNNTYINSIACDEPFYNYYQFVSHRSITNISLDELKSYLQDDLLINGSLQSYQDMDKDSADDSLTRSQFYDNEEEFYQYQYEFGANAIMMFALACNESANGKSSLAYTRNNLFGHAAYDSDVEKNASRYLSIKSSIYSHAKYYISGSYCYPKKFTYHGGFFGNKASGMNVSYASDPYWGEKAAMYYYKIDEYFGFKDLNYYNLGIINANKQVDIYQYPDTNSDILYSSTTTGDYAFIILSSFESNGQKWYKIQSDATLDDNSEVSLLYNYDYANHVAYILQDSIDHYLAGNYEEADFVNVSFDSDGGTFKDGTDLISYNIIVDSVPSVGIPSKENALFVGWDKNISNVSEDTYYYAVYQDVDAIELVGDPKKNYKQYERIDIEDLKVKVLFSDGSSKTYDLDTSMISNFNTNEPGVQQVVITFAGKQISYEIEVSAEAYLNSVKIANKVNEILMLDINELTEDDISNIISLKDTLDDSGVSYLNFDQIRKLDALVYETIKDHVGYAINGNKNLSVSGLSLAILDDTKNSFIEPLYKLNYHQNSKNAATLKKVAIANGYEVYDTFDLSLKRRFENVDINSPLIITINKPEGYQENDVFSVFTYVDGEVRKCYTMQTKDNITFMSDKLSSYIVVSKKSSNIYDIENIKENMTYDDNVMDVFEIAGVILGIILLALLAFIGILKIRRIRQYDSKKGETEQDQI